MQAVLATAIPVNELGVLMLKAGSALSTIPRGRVLVMPAPASMDTVKSGAVTVPSVIEESPLLEDRRLDPLWRSVCSMPYYRDGLQAYVAAGHGCQLADEGCHKEITIRRAGDSWVRVCWAHDMEPDPQAVELMATRNRTAYCLRVIASELHIPFGAPVRLHDVCWWAAYRQQADLLPDGVIRQALNRDVPDRLPVMRGWVETDDRFHTPPMEQLARMESPLRSLIVDADPPSRAMLRPKPMVWSCEAYTKYVKGLPCCVCGKQADDPHHLIGHGQGKMGGKAHDLFTIPLCRPHHDELHRDMSGWERRHGSQLQHLVATLDRALKEGALE